MKESLTVLLTITTRKCAQYTTMLIYGQHKKTVYQSEPSGNAFDHLDALIAGLQALKEPCEVTISVISNKEELSNCVMEIEHMLGITSMAWDRYGKLAAEAKVYKRLIQEAFASIPCRKTSNNDDSFATPVEDHL